MYSLFRDAISFDQDISGWDVSNVENMDGMFDNTALTYENKCSIHLAFSENENWPYDWSYECSLVDCEGDVDECGVCNGDGPEDGFDCDGNCVAIYDCDGLCGGENFDCEISIELEQGDDNNFLVQIDNPGPQQIASLQLRFSGVTIDTAYSLFGVPEDFIFSTGQDAIVGFSLSGSTFESAIHNVEFSESDGEMCLINENDDSNWTTDLFGSMAEPLTFNIGDCIVVDEPE